MMPCPWVAAREMERQRAERAAEAARQLPLHADDPTWREPPEDGAGDDARFLPDWASHY